MDTEGSEEVVLRLPDDIHKLCRTCLSVSNDKNQICHNILVINEFNKLTEVAEMLQNCSSVKVRRILLIFEIFYFDNFCFCLD